ncbi:MAG: hypothetical protein NZT61_04335 [Deltaproteobacteria bacterium]|nr:hypothetical protein [Deltaproteobacteria bacterium]
MLLRTSLITAVIVLVLGCQPRGETKSVEEILSISKERFNRAYSASEFEKKKQVGKVIDILNSILEKPTRTDFLLLGEHLMMLLPHASPTVKTSLYYQADTSFNLAEKDSISRGELFLFASRVYHSLSSELETSKFNYNY